MPAHTQARQQLSYSRLVAMASNATSVVQPRSGSPLVVPAAELVRRAADVSAFAESIAGTHVANVELSLMHAAERGDLLGLSAAHDAPTAGASPLWLLPTIHWQMALDPTGVECRLRKSPRFDRQMAAGVGVAGGWWNI